MGRLVDSPRHSGAKSPVTLRDPSSYERDGCGVGFVASLDAQPRHEHLQYGLHGLARVEHRGGVLADGKTGDGAGIMAEIPFELLGHDAASVAVATQFTSLDASGRRRADEILEATFATFHLKVIDRREVPIETSVLGRQARATLPRITQLFIAWPEFCRTKSAFDARLYAAKQALRTQLCKAGFINQNYMVSLSTSTVVYKALVQARHLADFYPDLRNPAFKTRFCLFHRRFSTNTSTGWDKAQPFRMIAHNGEINTIACNRAWGIAREQALGLPSDELLSHEGISDSGSLNEMVEALRYRSSIPNLPEVLALTVPPAKASPYYQFWGRAMEPWDGPAFLAFSDGLTVGARLDRNGFRPCRWSQTSTAFFLASEAGIFGLDPAEVVAQGHLHGGSGAHVDLGTGELVFEDPATRAANADAHFDPRVQEIGRLPPPAEDYRHNQKLFGYTTEAIDRLLLPMATTGKEPISSMGDTARLAAFSEQRRSFFDYFFQTFAQVTNPPLDALREKTVTDLSSYLGRRPNVFHTKELLPLTPGIRLATPIVDLQELAWLEQAPERSAMGRAFEVVTLSTTFPRVRGTKGLNEALNQLAQRALQAVDGGCSVLILSDRLAKPQRPPIPSLLALRAVEQALTRAGRRLQASLVVDTGDAYTTHHVAALVGFGAAAVCPYLALQVAAAGASDSDLSAEQRTAHLLEALRAGLLKIMSKMGISTVQGYLGARLFTAVGLGPKLVDEYFQGIWSPIGGLELEDIARRVLHATANVQEDLHPLPSLHLFRENAKGLGEPHSITSRATRLVHQVCEDHELRFDRKEQYDAYLREVSSGHPISPRHLLELTPSLKPFDLEDVQPRSEILRKLGTGSMSFGAISAESQRDLIRAMRRTGGRSASGEGGENPYYYVDGTTASTKQVASGRFGVTAEYLIVGDELEIKVAQGAKPGEGGQLMAVKVDSHIARARHSNPGVDLISPPPLHDIYSIEDLRELIYELKQLEEGKRVCVKLVAGAGIGAVAAGVVKAGADIVHISGGDGGTGAATVSSMRHAGLPWEFGLAEVHRTLTEQDLRGHVVLRTDGGLLTGEDIVKATLLGAEEVSFGKLLLIAEGCIMARVCEKNTCPRGIATHDPKFKKKYRGRVDDVVTFLNYLAEDVRRHLATMGVNRLEQLVGQASRLRARPEFEQHVHKLGLDLSGLQYHLPHASDDRGNLASLESANRLNLRVLDDSQGAVKDSTPLRARYPIISTDRAIPAALCGALARRTEALRAAARPASTPDLPPDAETPLPGADPESLHLPQDTIDLTFDGSAGQGFGVFTTRGLRLTLVGEANDAVAKAMSGGEVIVRPFDNAGYAAEASAIIGNCALYGATGGALYVRGRAADRFAVRNSGATAVVEGVGLHACEYMTRGTVLILGSTSDNVGAGMTGGQLFLAADQVHHLNRQYVCEGPLGPEEVERFTALLQSHGARTDSKTARSMLQDMHSVIQQFVVVRPRS